MSLHWTRRLRRRVETPPGAQAQVDWAHFPGIVVGGVSQDLVALHMVLSWSRKAAIVWSDTKDILPLLSEMQTAHEQMVVVVDEYGGTAGIITIEDIVEEFVGEIEDEFDPDNKYLTRLSRRECSQLTAYAGALSVALCNARS